MLMPFVASWWVTSARTPGRLRETTLIRCTNILHESIDPVARDAGHDDEMRNIALRRELPFVAHGGRNLRKHNRDCVRIAPSRNACSRKPLLRIRRDFKRRFCPLAQTFGAERLDAMPEEQRRKTAARTANGRVERSDVIDGSRDAGDVVLARHDDTARHRRTDELMTANRNAVGTVRKVECRTRL